MRYSTMLSSFILAIGIGGGLIGAGFLTCHAIIAVKKADRFVTVKGIAERNVKSNLGIWEVDYREVGNSLSDLSAKVTQDQKVVTDFLISQGFKTSEIEVRPPRVNDLLANPDNQPNTMVAQTNRYIVIGGVRIHSENVDQIQKVSQMTGELIKAGIPLSFSTSDYANDLSPNPSYFYTQLDSIRPQMLAEATQSARAVASQFAKDSQSHLGDIRRANQGVFQMMSADSSNNEASGSGLNEASSINKKVRLVTTIDYYLKG